MNGGPARTLAMDGEFTDEVPQVSDEDTVKFEGIYDEHYEENGGPSVLGRLWTGFSSKLNLFGSGELGMVVLNSNLALSLKVCG